MREMVRPLYFAGLAGLMAVSLATAGSTVPASSSPGLSPRTLSVLSTYGVWYSEQVYLPFYSEMAVVTYLSELCGGAQCQFTIVPVYSPAPLHFRRGDVVYVSTGLILQAAGEEDLLNAIRSEIKHIAPAGSDFREMQAKLSSQIAAYVEQSTPHLSRRF